jgi:hypothetical protein
MKAFLALTLFSLVSCAGLPSILQNSLVGEWRYADKTKGCHYVFHRNGTFSGDVNERGRTVMKFTGRWSIEGDTLLYTYINDALGRIPAGATDRDKIFIIEAADGSKRKYVRVPSEKKPPNLRVTLSGESAHFAHYFARAKGQLLGIIEIKLPYKARLML